MLSAEKNRILTQVGPGTPMGDYLRRYWMPIGGASELDPLAIKPIRLLGTGRGNVADDRGNAFDRLDDVVQ